MKIFTKIFNTRISQRVIKVIPIELFLHKSTREERLKKFNNVKTRDFNVGMLFHHQFFANDNCSLFEKVAVNSQSILLWDQHVDEEEEKELG